MGSMHDIFGPPPELPPEARDAIERLHKAEADAQIAWRQTMTGPWAMLFCACRLPEDGGKRQSMLKFRPAEPLSAGCPVHGTFLVTYKGVF
jgi:hypothetical protein